MRGYAWLLLGWLVCTPSFARAQDTDALLVGGGRFLESADSLSFEAYRSLPAKSQLARRDDAKRWLRRSRDAAAEASSAAEAPTRERMLVSALDACATAVGLCPYLPQAWVAYARYLNELGRYDQADAALVQAERTLRYEPSEDRQREVRADYHRIDAAVAYNRGATERSLASALVTIEIEPRDHQTRLLAARALVELERYDEARAQLAGFDDRDPSYAASLAVLALLEMRAERYAASAEAFRRAHEYGMRGAVFDNDRGRLYLAMGEFDTAVGYFESAIAQVPSMYEARSNLAVAHRRAGRLDVARAVLEAILFERDDYVPAHFNLAEVAREQLDAATDPQRRLELGALAFRHYTLALDGGHDPALVVERRAQLAFVSDDLEGAEADLLRMTEDPSFDGRVLFMLGRVKKEQGRLDIAINLLQMAQRRGYDDPLLDAEIGEVLVRRGDLEGAAVALEAARRKGPDLVVTRVNLSSVLAQLGRADEADAVLREAEALDPDHPLVVQQRAKLGAAAQTP